MPPEGFSPTPIGYIFLYFKFIFPSHYIKIFLYVSIRGSHPLKTKIKIAHSDYFYFVPPEGFEGLKPIPLIEYVFLSFFKFKFFKPLFSSSIYSFHTWLLTICELKNKTAGLIASCFIFVPPEGFEPPTISLRGSCSTN